MSDCADLHSLFDHCRSIRVESGMFIIYDQPGFMGNQYFMRRGEYSDYMGMTGMNDCVRSCRMIPMVCLFYFLNMQIIFYEDKDFSGSHFECSKDCPDLLSNLSRCNSIRVESSCFMIYEKPNYTGNQYYLRRGEYPNFHHWSGINDSVGSCRHIHTVSCC
ncbi:hypothetical protein XENOCAPTIV_005743 [Xenoophorus captivus]|uniref:Beta/gamma crystallin 'Greek key' domain-containing protein n=1 Tax=Xenoophorus captivus TaxID=1517983 RepID=A0ABV0QGS3_9TELE